MNVTVAISSPRGKKSFVLSLPANDTSVTRFTELLIPAAYRLAADLNQQMFVAENSRAKRKGTIVSQKRCKKHKKRHESTRNIIISDHLGGDTSEIESEDEEQHISEEEDGDDDDSPQSQLGQNINDKGQRSTGKATSHTWKIIKSEEDIPNSMTNAIDRLPSAEATKLRRALLTYKFQHKLDRFKKHFYRPESWQTNYGWQGGWRGTTGVISCLHSLLVNKDESYYCSRMKKTIKLENLTEPFELTLKDFMSLTEEQLSNRVGKQKQITVKYKQAPRTEMMTSCTMLSDIINEKKRFAKKKRIISCTDNWLVLTGRYKGKTPRSSISRHNRIEDSNVVNLYDEPDDRRDEEGEAGNGDIDDTEEGLLDTAVMDIEECEVNKNYENDKCSAV